MGGIGYAPGMTGPVSFTAACVQLRSTGDVAENIRQTSAFVREAAAGGARFIATPENTNIMAQDSRAKLAATFDKRMTRRCRSLQGWRRT